MATEESLLREVHGNLLGNRGVRKQHELSGGNQ